MDHIVSQPRLSNRGQHFRMDRHGKKLKSLMPAQHRTKRDIEIKSLRGRDTKLNHRKVPTLLSAETTVA